jgi:hypothetical protein
MDNGYFTKCMTNFLKLIFFCFMLPVITAILRLILLSTIVIHYLYLTITAFLSLSCLLYSHSTIVELNNKS